MNVIAALHQRKSVRAFLKHEVEEDKINIILAAARHGLRLRRQECFGKFLSNFPRRSQYIYSLF